MPGDQSDSAYTEPLTAPFSHFDGFMDLTISNKELTILESEKLMKRLIDRAKYYQRIPEDFYYDMFLLVFFEKQIETGKREDVDSNRKIFRSLKIEYEIKDVFTTPETYTMLSLGVLFPHFSFIDILGPPKYDLSSASGPYELTKEREFAGLIPDPGAGKLFMDDETRLELIVIHLFGVMKSRPLLCHSHVFQYFKCRCEKSLLSNERRAQFLENIGVITSDGFLSSRMQTAIEGIEHWRKSTAYQTIKRLMYP